MNFNPQNILIINFGQIGDVILSLPAFSAVRGRFPQAKITAMIGKSGADIVEISGLTDEKIVVDRVKLRDGKKSESIAEVLKITREVRRRQFDFVLDLHSLYETNALGWLSGAKQRLYANRESRSLDFLANFRPPPPREDKKLHLTDNYLNALKPLGIENAPRVVKIEPRAADLEKIETLLENSERQRFVGLFPGAGNVSRRWHLDKFAAFAGKISQNTNWQPIVFLGPEEADLRGAVEDAFPAEIVIIDKLSLTEFVAALAKMAVLVSNDTGAIHLAALVGTPVVLVMDERAPTTYLPLTERISVVNNASLDRIGVPEVFQAMRKFIEE